MPTDKYDLHTIDYSVQGWDAILATDMEQLDDVIPARVLGTLGETVASYQAVYLKASDSKWHLAKADGVLQGFVGIALEAGDEDDPIRIVKLGEIVNAAWAWANIGQPVYLSPSTAGALTQTKPAGNVQIVAYALTATTLLVTTEFIKTAGEWNVSRGGTVILPSGAINVIVWEAPFSCTVKTVKGYRVGGTGATINARRNGVDTHLSSALSLTSANTWMDGGAVQNTAYVAGNRLEIMIVTVTGSPTQIAVQVDFEV